jgi:membrane fusion protein (multidrug efflux system)
MDQIAEIENENTLEPNAPEPPEAPEAPAHSRRLLLLALVGAIVIALAATGLWLHYRYRVSTDDAQVDGHIGPISSKVSGTVSQVLIENNQHVQAGQVLVRIDPRDYESNVKQARAALQLAESQARAAQAGVPLTREITSSGTSGAAAQVATAEAEYNRARTAAAQAATADIDLERSNVAAAQANYDRAHADLERMRPLAEKAEISRQQFDAYVAAERMAAAQLKAALDKLAAAEQKARAAEEGVAAARARVEQARAGLAQSRAGERQVTVTAAQAESARAAVEQARANVEAAQLQLSYTTITAPIEGQVTRKTVEVGQVVQPGQALMSIVPLHNVWVTANYKETQLANVHPGQKAEVKIDMYVKTIEGRVQSIAGATGAKLSLLPPENATGNFVKVPQRIPVKIVFDHLPEGMVLRPGMNVEATILTK